MTARRSREKAVSLLESLPQPWDVESGIMADINPRGERLRRTAAYLGDFETVPIPESCSVAEGDALAHGSFGVTASRLPNVLAEDTWELSSVLLR